MCTNTTNRLDTIATTATAVTNMDINTEPHFHTKNINGTENYNENYNPHYNEKYNENPNLNESIKITRFETQGNKKNDEFDYCEFK